MGVADFSVLGAVHKFRSLIAGPTPSTATADEDAIRRTSGPPSPATPTRSASPVDMPPLPARSGGRRAIALRRQISSPQLLRCHAVRRGDGEDDDEPGVQFFTPGNDYLHDFSDTDSLSVSTPNGIIRSLTPSPLESPTWMVGQNDASPTSKRDERLSLDSLGCDTKPYGGVTDRSQGEMTRSPVDFDANIWLPPPPEDEGDDAESRLFGFDDEDDEAGDSGKLLGLGSFSTNKIAGVQTITDIAHKEGLRNAVLGHFRALVAQLLKGECVDLENGNRSKSWLEIVSSLAWLAAGYVRPDTKKGGSMDPTDYVKVKCLASGDPSDSNLVRGVVCSKNVKHKRMISEHVNAKLLILGGALEYQKVTNKLASIDTILEQEKEHLRAIVAKIESRRPNVLLVEKSVSSYAQELLAKDISLVLNIKRPLLDRISRCSGAQIASSIDNIASARLGQCELFKVQKVPEFLSGKLTNRRSMKTLMFFEGCPRRLGCTVLLRGSCREELKKIKRVVQLAVFAAYHLSLETSFFADEGATLPRIPSRPMIVVTDVQSDPSHDFAGSAGVGIPYELKPVQGKYSETTAVNDMFEEKSASPRSLSLNEEGQGVISEHRESKIHVDHMNCNDHYSSHATDSCKGHKIFPCSLDHDSRTSDIVMQYQYVNESRQLPITNDACQGMVSGKKYQEVDHYGPKPHDDYLTGDADGPNKLSGEYFPATDNHQSILVSLSSTCIPKSMLCERSQLFRIKFYGSFDKPLGRYLREDLFDQAYCCPSCKEPSESHIRCYTHQHGSLTISVRRLLSQKLPGERDGRIWMWHRCLKCEPKDGVPPATRRVIMSDAAWGLSFGKFLELSFSNHATANRIASCGHSLQRDCLRFYGYGNMVAFFRYSPVDILSVNLPPSVLGFNCHSQQDWMRRMAHEIYEKMESLHSEVYGFLHRNESTITSEDEPVKTGVQRQIIEMKDLLKMERNGYEILLLPVITDNSHSVQISIDILELNRLRRCLLLDAYIWDQRLCYIDSLLKKDGHDSNPSNPDNFLDVRLKEWKTDLLEGDTKIGKSTNLSQSSGSPRKSLLSREGCLNDTEYRMGETNSQIDFVYHSIDDSEDLDKVFSRFNGEKEQSITKATTGMEPAERLPSLASIISDKIDLAWTGSSELYDFPQDCTKIDEHGSFSFPDNLSCGNAATPVRIHSFDSKLVLRQRERNGLAPTSLHLSSFRSAEYFGDLSSIMKDPLPNIRRACSQRSPGAVEKLNVVLTRTLTYVSPTSHMIDDGARLLLPQIGYEDDAVIAVYDDEPTSIVSYAMTSQEYVQQVTRKPNSSLSFLHLPNTIDSSHGLDGAMLSQEDHLDSKGTHFKFSFDDESPLSEDKAKFSVICYFAKHFAALRKKCCPKDIDFIRSLSRCKRWNAQGGKSNVYFAKTLDERFIIKQVTRTELESFVEFAPQYFRYLMESLTSGSPTCLAKIVGLYQVNIKGLKGGREVKMDLMVMENLFFERKISRVYDLKGSLRSRYTSSESKVLLDSNLVETLHTKPLFLGSKAKRRLERAIWNDTSFLATADVMDYSLLVGIDEEKKELVIGIIDYLRQYTWDKQLETWVKASGILGGPKNESPTIISPMQYKKRFRKAMSKYFLTVPDQWST
ncbi:putative 1-phosphatidylinositol-3-phosphate 5-kinase FAB1C [Oryza brachyantha]|uniref:putative 1-phosphatidylinositol-3-phosphate 5-kinase FAB1C n=1 Tax=Oryza brachyantha TaxID=4533 RepID=UPI001ADB431A|nr:putative 1-phosphatidylinositol-3-phosphate 5-kinase FAB1C [Oryza brachyantha]